jgi:uncharacterized membrane protein
MASLPLLRAIHVTSAVLLLGNVVVTGFWATYLYRVRDAVPFHPVARAILWADLWFTLLGGTGLVVSGVLLVMAQGYPLSTPWIRHGIEALGVSTLLWLTVLLPDQWRLERIGPGDVVAPRRTFLRWSVVGWAATLALFVGLWAMVAKV